MNKTMLILGTVSLAVGAFLFLLGLDFFSNMIGGIKVSVYPGWFFALLGGLLVLMSLFRKPVS